MSINEILQWGVMGGIFLFSNHNFMKVKDALHSFYEWNTGQQECLDHLHKDVEKNQEVMRESAEKILKEIKKLEEL